MAQRRKRKKRKWLRLNRQTHAKLLATFAIIILLFGGLMGRLLYIQHTSGAKYQKIVLAQQEYDSVTLPFRRGDIADSKGTVLATSTDVYHVILDCSQLLSDARYLEPTLYALMKSFPELEESKVRDYVRENPDSRYYILLKKMSYERIHVFMQYQNGELDMDMEIPSEIKEAYKKSHDEDANEDQMKKDIHLGAYVKGIWFEKHFERQYPYKSLASAVIGFSTASNEGMSGLENYYNDTLNGTNGRQYGYLNSDNAVEKTIKPAVDGNTLVTTIDMTIQSVVETKIADFNKAYTDAAYEGGGAKHIGVVVEDPNTGEILAMANYPNFDLSNAMSLDAYYDKEEYEKMTDEQVRDALSEMWQNFCISYTYEPGSTQKPLTVAAGLDSGKLKGNEGYECKGFEKVGDREIYCVNRNGHGMETLQGALMDSCNAALMQMVRVIGKEDFCKYQSIFGMGRKTNIDLPGEARTDTLIRSVEDTTPIDLATESFGQNYNCTMIQMIGAFASVINGGNYYQPHVVSKITDENGNVVKNFQPQLLKQTVSLETSNKMKQYLYATVSDGTAKLAKVPGYSMGGKTGTAEKLPRRTGEYLVSFIGYVPQEHPQLVIYAVIDTPNQSKFGEAQAHSSFAQNLVREILEEILPYMNIYKDEKPAKDALTKKETNMYTGIAGYEAKAELGEAVQY